MWAHVRFLCDQKTANIPRSFIQDEGELGLNQECHVFWSPDPQETPKDILSKQGKILNIDTLIEIKNKKKTKQPINGYYRAIILKLADTEEELDNMGQERIRYPARKRSPSPSGLIGTNIQTSVFIFKKMKKMQHQEAFQFNLNETLSIGNDSTKEQLQVKIKKLEAKYNRLKVEMQDLRALNINLQKQMFRLSALPSPATLPIPLIFLMLLSRFPKFRHSTRSPIGLPHPSQLLLRLPLLKRPPHPCLLLPRNQLPQPWLSHLSASWRLFYHLVSQKEL
ncbi:hypothetical protein JTE90_008633 [Oedothorax gibbosus]|uniref:Uncharacterized protein n=1 Tax=Oedothorax gibbosus TaxID=931172 RepID=A0AAV6U0A0_9ARAC|nr:hypothetical protein JTE90_008633 [Oedothorax gibbosus]